MKVQSCTNHIPCEVGEPVGGWVDAADEVKVFRAGNSLTNEEEDERGWDGRHREDDGDRNQNVDP